MAAGSTELFESLQLIQHWFGLELQFWAQAPVSGGSTTSVLYTSSSKMKPALTSELSEASISFGKAASSN